MNMENGVVADLNPSALKVLSAIWNEGPIARTTLAERTGLAHSSITRITRMLGEQGLIVETVLPDDADSEPLRGRPPVLLALNAEAGVVLAVDLSAIMLQGAIYNLAGRSLYSCEEPFAGTGEKTVLRQVVSLLAKLKTICGSTNRTALAIAVSVPGVIDQDKGRIVEVTNLDLHNVSLADALVKEFHLPVHIEHDTMAAAYAERFYGAGIDNESLIYIMVSQGIGAGILLNNQIFRGVYGAAGELGHITIRPNGPRCLCGRKGCLEAMAGAQAILAHVREGRKRTPREKNAKDADSFTSAEVKPTGLDDELTMQGVIEAAAAGDEIARKALARAARHVAQAIGTLATTLDVRCIIVGGEIAEAIEAFLVPLTKHLPDFLFSREHTVSVFPSQLKQEAAIKGVSILALQQVLGLYR